MATEFSKSNGCEQTGSQDEDKKPVKEPDNLSFPLRQSDGFLYCNFCPKKYATAEELRLHMEVHSPNPTCRICNRIYTSSAYYYMHMKHKHGIYLATPRARRLCKYCGREGIRRFRKHEIKCRKQKERRSEIEKLVCEQPPNK